jgi:DNA invertase Pin-like site-specific DNA recombinase
MHCGRLDVLKILTQNTYTASASGQLIFTVFSAIAEFEREIIRDRTHARLDAARSRGRKGGRPWALSDKDLKQARALLADPEMYRCLPAARQAAQQIDA